MPFVLIILGVVFLTVAVRNTQDELFRLVKGDFTGPNNYAYWVLAILIIGAVGYIPRLKPISTAFLILVVLVLILKKGTGFFDSFNQQLASGTAATPASRDAGAVLGATVAKTAAGLV